MKKCFPRYTLTKNQGGVGETATPCHPPPLITRRRPHGWGQGVAVVPPRRTPMLGAVAPSSRKHWQKYTRFCILFENSAPYLITNLQCLHSFKFTIYETKSKVCLYSYFFLSHSFFYSENSQPSSGDSGNRAVSSNDARAGSQQPGVASVSNANGN